MWHFYSIEVVIGEAYYGVKTCFYLFKGLVYRKDFQISFNLNISHDVEDLVLVGFCLLMRFT